MEKFSSYIDRVCCGVLADDFSTDTHARIKSEDAQQEKLLPSYHTPLKQNEKVSAVILRKPSRLSYSDAKNSSFRSYIDTTNYPKKHSYEISPILANGHFVDNVSPSKSKLNRTSSYQCGINTPEVQPVLRRSSTMFLRKRSTKGIESFDSLASFHDRHLGIPDQNTNESCSPMTWSDSTLNKYLYANLIGKRGLQVTKLSKSSNNRSTTLRYIPTIMMLTWSRRSFFKEIHDKISLYSIKKVMRKGSIITLISNRTSKGKWISLSTNICFETHIEKDAAILEAIITMLIRHATVPSFK